MSKTNKNNALANAIVFNNKFANRMVNAEQISVENLDMWKNAVVALHKSVYNTLANAQNYALENAESLDSIFVELRSISAIIGEVNGFKLRCDINDAIAIAPYALRDANNDKPELQLCLSRIALNKKMLAQYKAVNGTNPDSIAMLEKEISTLEEEKAKLLDTADMRVKKVTRTSDNAFRLALEHYLARKINGQMAESYEDILAREEALKKARAEKRKANKKSK